MPWPILTLPAQQQAEQILHGAVLANRQARAFTEVGDGRAVACNHPCTPIDHLGEQVMHCYCVIDHSHLQWQLAVPQCDLAAMALLKAVGRSGASGQDRAGGTRWEGWAGLAPLFPSVSTTAISILRCCPLQPAKPHAGPHAGRQTHVLCDKPVYSQPASPASTADWASVAGQRMPERQGADGQGGTSLPFPCAQGTALTSATTCC